MQEYKIGDTFKHSTDFGKEEISANGIIVYVNDDVAVARVWWGSYEMITSLDSEGFSYTYEEIKEMYPDFEDEHKKRIEEYYLLIDTKTNYFIGHEVDEEMWEETRIVTEEEANEDFNLMLKQLSSTDELLAMLGMTRNDLPQSSHHHPSENLEEHNKQ